MSYQGGGPSCVFPLTPPNQKESDLSHIRGMVKNLPLLRGAGNNGRPWVHALMSDYIYSDICMIIHASTLYAAPYNGTTNIIGIKDKFIFWANDSGIYSIYNKQQNLILWDSAPLCCGKEWKRIGLSVYWDTVGTAWFWRRYTSFTEIAAARTSQ